MDKSSTEIFIRNFMGLIKQRHINAGWLSEKSGIPLSSLNRILGEVSVPSQNAIAKLCEAIDMSPDEVIEMKIPHESISKEDDSIVLTAHEKSIVIAYRQLSDDHWLKKAIGETLLSD